MNPAPVKVNVFPPINDDIAPEVVGFTGHVLVKVVGVTV
jgi:hypothetical protein